VQEQKGGISLPLFISLEIELITHWLAKELLDIEYWSVTKLFVESSEISIEFVVGTGVSGTTTPLIQDLVTGSKLWPTPQSADFCVDGAQEKINKGINRIRYIFTTLGPRSLYFLSKYFSLFLKKISKTE